MQYVESSDEHRKQLVVGIGASAGGLEALLEFFQSLPSDTGLSYIVARHIGYNVPSYLDQILARNIDMEVTEVHEQIELQPNEIYVTSSKCNIEVTDDHVRPVMRPQQGALNFSVDELFHTLGKAVGERAVAIVLSGAGSDGSRGLKTIKEAGGTVLVQSPDSALFNGMPYSALLTNLADYVFPPPILAEVVRQLARHPNANYLLLDPKQERFDQQYQQIIGELSKRGVDLKGYESRDVTRHLEHQMFISRCQKISDYLKTIREQPEKAELFYQDFLLELPLFFQDKAAFKIIAKRAIPDLADLSRKDPNRSLRLWTVGCATGEEAVSLALLLEEQFGANTSYDRYRIFASDINAHATKKAALTTFPVPMSQDIPHHLQKKYFIKHDSTFQLKQHVSDKIVFMVHNALSDPPLLNMDFISCRYLLKYLKSEYQQKLLEKLTSSLQSGGYLFLGPEESLGALSDRYSVIDGQWKIFQKK